MQVVSTSSDAYKNLYAYYEKNIAAQQAGANFQPEGIFSQQSTAISAMNAAAQGKVEIQNSIPAPAQKALQAQSANGISASVYSNTSPDGKSTGYTLNLSAANGSSLSLPVAETLRVGKTEDGSYAVHFAESGKTRLYNADGSYTEVEGNAITADADSIYVCPEGTTVRGGNGNNIYMVCGNNATVHGGSGNDEVHLADGASGASINTGSGDDKVSGVVVHNSRIELGEGNNKVNIGHAYGTDVNARHGNNTLNMGVVNGGSVTLGDGDNFFKGYEFCAKGGFSSEESTLSMGNGNNKIDIYILGELNPYASSRKSGHIQVGNGDNKIKLYEAVGSSSINAGNGNNSLSIYELEENSSLKVGNGNNTLGLHDLEGNASCVFGNGNNRVTMYELTDNASFMVGNGNNSFAANDMRDQAAFVAGHGNNSLHLASMRNSASVTLGDGNNDVVISRLYDMARAALGDGDNLLHIKELRDQALLELGNGNNTGLVRFKANQANIQYGEGDSNIMVVERERNETPGQAAAIDKAIDDMCASLEARRKEREANGLPANQEAVTFWGFGEAWDEVDYYGKNMPVEEGNELSERLRALLPPNTPALLPFPQAF